jgi:hypothetical protein
LYAEHYKSINDQEKANYEKEAALCNLNESAELMARFELDKLYKKHDDGARFVGTMREFMSFYANAHEEDEIDFNKFPALQKYATVKSKDDAKDKEPANDAKPKSDRARATP